jgi:transcriptional regulator with XRE-family HTH domain
MEHFTPVDRMEGMEEKQAGEDASVVGCCSGAENEDAGARTTGAGASSEDEYVRGPAGRAFREYRESVGLGLREASRRLGADQRHIGRVERGEDVRLSTLEGLAAAYGVTLRIILEPKISVEEMRRVISSWRREEQDLRYEARKERRMRKRGWRPALPAA